jgi:GABA(A) receptor-associated protein
MNFKFKVSNPEVETRRLEAAKIREKYPDRLPVICEKDPKSKLNEVDKTKYLVPHDLTISQFSYIIRKRLEMSKDSALFLLVAGKHSITGDTSMNEIYETYKDKDDGFLYIAYTSELTWGANTDEE